MDFKKLLSTFDAVENNTSENAINKKKEAGSMLAILESFDNAGVEESSVTENKVCENCGCDVANPTAGCECSHNEVEEAVGEFAGPLYDLIDELGSHQLVLDELVRYLDGDTIADFVADFRRHHDMDMNEGKMSDQLIHDSETMSKEEFTKKHGKEVADEYFESVNEAKPDFLDIDNDGDKKESMKKAAKDKEDKEETNESVEEIEEAIMVSAEGAEAAELLSILKLSGMPASEPAPALPAPMEPEMDMQDEYSNSPDEMEQDVDAVIASGDDMHREKDQYAASADGDNPMKAFEGQFKSIMDDLLAEDNK